MSVIMNVWVMMCRISKQLLSYRPKPKDREVFDVRTSVEVTSSGWDRNSFLVLSLLEMIMMVMEYRFSYSNMFL